MKKIDSQTKKKITADWHRAFPDLGVYKPMWLLRRCGPILTGICLERGGDNDSYMPIAHIHCLANRFDFVAFGLSQRLQSSRTGAPQTISAQWHESKWRDAAERLAQQSLLPFSGAISLESIENAFRSAPTREDTVERRSTNIYRDWLLTIAWTGRREKLEKLFEHVERNVNAWPDFIFERHGGVAAWLMKLRELTSDTEKVRRTVEEEAMKHNAGGLPSVDVSSWLI